MDRQRGRQETWNSQTWSKLNEFPLDTNRLLFNTIKSSLFYYRHQCKNKQCDQDKGSVVAVSLSFSLSLLGSYHHLSVDKLKGTKPAPRKLMSQAEQVGRKALDSRVGDRKKCEALMSMTRSSDKRTAFLCSPINCLLFKTVLAFSKRTRMLRQS